MTKQEARKIATAMNNWRRDLSLGPPMPCAFDFGRALDVLTQPSTIAENIRNAAINWPQFLGPVESHILYSFLGIMEHPDFGSIDGRMFLLLTAEALES